MCKIKEYLLSEMEYNIHKYVFIMYHLKIKIIVTLERALYICWGSGSKPNTDFQVSRTQLFLLDTC